MNELKKELWGLIKQYGNAMAQTGYNSHHDDIAYFLKWADAADDLEIKIQAFIANVEMKEK